MSQSSKTFRVFVSSTFKDFKMERNALQEQVFPRLRELCAKYDCHFQAIDLRWGVSEEAALDQRTRICTEDIARCRKITRRPNFIALLGARYGWRPLPAEISADEFDNLTSCRRRKNERSEGVAGASPFDGGSGYADARAGCRRGRRVRVGARCGSRPLERRRVSLTLSLIPIPRSARK
jgi:uncharacterized protein DUF4062